MIMRVMNIGASDSYAVMAGHSRSKDGVAFARLCPDIHVFLAACQDMDGRDKPGHDDVDRHVP
jgi:hypothetical protein